MPTETTAPSTHDDRDRDHEIDRWEHATTYHLRHEAQLLGIKGTHDLSRAQLIDALTRALATLRFE